MLRIMVEMMLVQPSEHTPLTSTCTTSTWQIRMVQGSRPPQLQYVKRETRECFPNPSVQARNPYQGYYGCQFTGYQVCRVAGLSSNRTELNVIARTLFSQMLLGPRSAHALLSADVLLQTFPASITATAIYQAPSIISMEARRLGRWC